MTSPTGAAIHDIVNVLTRRTKTVDLVLIPAVVQGDAAPESIRRGVIQANRFNETASEEDRIDVLIVGRGGGSSEDLSAFNDELLARAIFDSKIPVVSAVGHEIDVSISDYVADLRAPTPSAAAELVAGSEIELRERLSSLAYRLGESLKLKVLNSERRLDDAVSSRGLRDVPVRVAEARDRVDYLLRNSLGAIEARRHLSAEAVGDLRRRLSPVRLSKELGDKKLRLSLLREAGKKAVENRIQHAVETLGRRAAELQALSPLGVLERGYSIAKSSDGRLLKDVDSVALGNEIEVTLKKGVVEAKVTGKRDE